MFKGAWLLFVGGIALAITLVVGIIVNIIPTTQAHQVKACEIAFGAGVVVGFIVWVATRAHIKATQAATAENVARSNV